MPDRSTAFDRLTAGRIVAVVRGPDPERMVDLVEALAAGGVAVVEVTYTVPKASQVIARIADRLGDGVLLGAGTVLDAVTACEAIDHGARFVVSPALRPEVVTACRKRDVCVAAGAFTPSEVLAAWETQPDLVKLFPCDLGGPAYVKALRGPFPYIPLMPTGGITLDNAAEFLQVGAAVLGVGSSLVDPGAVATGDWKQLESLARRFVEAVSVVSNH